MKKEYYVPVVEVVLPTMFLMGTDRPSPPNQPASDEINPDQPMAPSRKLYI